ncbi:MAG TPA: ester cyclase [Acidimicrobiales bacterium]|nr:ester cyclase [Acidimicrobiales bacterium]
MGPREVMEQLHETINAHDGRRGALLFDPSARIVTAAGRVVSLAGLGQILADTLIAFPDLEMRVERWIESGDVIVTEEIIEGTHDGVFAGMSPTGRRVRLPICHVTRVVDGKIVERVAYHDTAGILRQLT